MKQFFVILFLLFFSFSVSAQNNINHTRISIITCGPGDELYSLFGHTALRIIDSAAHSDIVYNWGGFTFDQPNFYLKFLRGKLKSCCAYVPLMSKFVFNDGNDRLPV